MTEQERKAQELEALADYMETIIDDKTNVFAMQTWFDRNGCSTIACIAGWECARIGVYDTHNRLPGIPMDRYAAVAAESLMLDGDEATALFTMNQQPYSGGDAPDLGKNYDDVTLAEALDAIRESAHCAREGKPVTIDVWTQAFRKSVSVLS